MSAVSAVSAVSTVIVTEELGPMANLTDPQIYSIARNAGFPPDAATEMTAIALRESSGNTQALNPNADTGDYSLGLWQINMLNRPGYNLESERIKLFGLSRKEDLYDPNVNAAAAYKLWSINGGYRDWKEIPVKFMPRAEAARIASGEGSYADLVTDPNTDWAGDGTSPIERAANSNSDPAPSTVTGTGTGDNPGIMEQLSTALGTLTPVTMALIAGSLLLLVMVSSGGIGGIGGIGNSRRMEYD